MSETLKEFLLHHIDRTGPMDIGTYMALSLSHPRFGYYMQRQPFGVSGDFMTAPEVSQMFGEMLGAWVADVWIKMGSPEFYLVEGGPGRGTLMQDVLRATKNVPGFAQAADIHLIETSPMLQSVQAEALKDFKVSWHDTIEKLPLEKPFIFVANELLDALPIRQLQKTKNGWMEVALYNKNSELVIGHRAFPQGFQFDAPDGAVYEFSPARDAFVKRLCEILKAQKGAALLIDYGNESPAYGSSLHAIHKHEKIELLSKIDDVDVSANVNFSDVKSIAQESGLKVFGSVEQGCFLKNLGIGQRSAMLMSKADPAQALDIEKALRRLTSSDEMGSLFKVMGLSHDESLTPAGF